MWGILLLILVALLVIKLVSLATFWRSYDLPSESFLSYLHRLLWRYSTNSVYDVMLEDAQRYGKVYGSFHAMKPTLIVRDPEIAKEVLIKQFGTAFFKRSFEFETGEPLTDKMINRLPYDQWKTVRTVMGYSFTTSKMKGMILKLDKVAKRAVAKLQPDQAVVLNALMKGYGMDSIVAIAFGIDSDCIDNPDSPWVKHAADLFKPGFSTLVMFLVPDLFKYIPFAQFPRKETVDFFGKMTRHVLAEKRKNLDEVIKNGTADILDLHLIAQREDPNNTLSEEVLASQAFLFFIGGLDTTVFTLELATYFLAINPDVQQEVYEELKRVMGDRTEVDYQDLQKLKLLEASLLETLRLAPVGFFVDRLCGADTEVAGIKIQKGTYVQFNLPAMNTDPEFFPEPQRFLPQRFMKGGEVASETAAFLMFGDGPKNCIGKRLALMNIQTLMANILLKFRLDRDEKTPVPIRSKSGLRFSDFSKDPLYIRLTARSSTDELKAKEG